MAIGDLKDRPPHGAGGLDGERLRSEARSRRDADTIVGDPAPELGVRSGGFSEVEHAVERP